MPAAPTFDALFDPQFLAALRPFALRARRVPAAGRPADQTSRQRGAGVEFADYKPYTPGDDLRHLDWNIYRRLGRLFVRVFEERRDLPVYLLVDRSKSMYLETPPRIEAGLKTALALAAIALGQHDTVRLLHFSEGLRLDAATAAGTPGLPGLARRLAALGEQAGTDLAGAVRDLAGRRLRRGLLVVVSDFFDPAGIDAVVGELALCRHRLLLVCLVRDVDADPAARPDLRGDVRLRDCESGAALDLTITPAVLARYRAAYAAFSARLTDFATERGAGLARVDAGQDVLPQITALFAGGALVV